MFYSSANDLILNSRMIRNARMLHPWSVHIVQSDSNFMYMNVSHQVVHKYIKDTRLYSTTYRMTGTWDITWHIGTKTGRTWRPTNWALG